ncbi:MtnX-like HAD-IB family phosphatase [Azorhizobium caulinodans]|nr:MtnX-like HAD-IB family phosphatase [Azorhizobium caulinodans]
MKLHFVLDFDGTICPTDTTDFILETFADPAWREVEADWETGLIDTRTCLSRQVDLLDVQPEVLDAKLRTLPLDPAFPAFVTEAGRRGAELQIVSDGFKRFIDVMLEAKGISLPTRSNHLQPLGSGRWAAQFPPPAPRCQNGTCKCAAAPRGRERVVLIGDGKSDFCLAERADFVLAKGRLAEFCRIHDIPHQRVSGFADALDYLLQNASTPRTAAFGGLELEDIHA